MQIIDAIKKLFTKKEESISSNSEKLLDNFLTIELSEVKVIDLKTAEKVASTAIKYLSKTDVLFKEKYKNLADHIALKKMLGLQILKASVRKKSPKVEDVTNIRTILMFICALLLVIVTCRYVIYGDLDKKGIKKIEIMMMIALKGIALVIGRTLGALNVRNHNLDETKNTNIWLNTELDKKSKIPQAVISV